MERVTAVTFKLSQASGKPIFGVSINVMVEDVSSATETRVNLEIYNVSLILYFSDSEGIKQGYDQTVGMRRLVHALNVSPTSKQGFLTARLII